MGFCTVDPLLVSETPHKGLIPANFILKTYCRNLGTHWPVFFAGLVLRRDTRQQQQQHYVNATHGIKVLQSYERRSVQIHRVPSGGDQMDVGVRSGLPNERRWHRNNPRSQHISHNSVGKKLLIWNINEKQECIPVGCVPPACYPYLPACTAPGRCTCLGGVPAWGVYLPGGCTYLGGVPAQVLPPVDRQTLVKT